ncbi:MAG: hypothetical protein Unbinned1473contig1001_41 [Prokaryotic dsDNA virus sp.]|nr:MAG: hypothetical protein Unbinned1473contig1001_41 [Prokaryotic dsDNA virus sp.]|tara:strand:+ start:9065 stop:9751 length:687 start_codon:yes stop_codon:yes gene_type:complete
MGMKPVNFAKVIAASGLSKKQIADMKGVKPETLSRHISGAIRMTFDDAFEYAEILKCPPQDIFFPAQPMPIIGITKMVDEPKEETFRTSFYREIWTGKPRFAYTASYEKAKDYGVFIHEGNEKYTGMLSFMTKSVDVVDVRPIKEGYIHDEAHQAFSYCKVADGYERADCNREKTNIVLTLPYKQPNGLFTLFNPGMNFEVRDIPLDWATPILATAMKPSYIFESVDI